jgi:hypothetical protein
MMAIGISQTKMAMKKRSGACIAPRTRSNSKGLDRRQNNCSIRPMVRVSWRRQRHRCCANASPTAATIHALKAVVRRSDIAVTCDC